MDRDQSAEVTDVALVQDTTTVEVEITALEEVHLAIGETQSFAVKITRGSTRWIISPINSH